MNRRGFLQQLGLVIAAPAIVRATSLMKVVPWDEPFVVPRLVIRTSIPATSWRILYHGAALPTDLAELLRGSDTFFDEAPNETL